MEEFRMQYPLDENSLVLDAGVYKGYFIDWCRQRWGCKILAFEPARVFYQELQARLNAAPGVTIFNYGLSDKDETLPLVIRGDSTSVYLGGASESGSETVSLRDVVGVFADLHLDAVDLFKINIEGGEYPLMLRMLDAALVQRVRFFQIQYHDLGSPDPKASRDQIRERLSATHKEQWCRNGGQWESWERR